MGSLLEMRREEREGSRLGEVVREIEFRVAG
jgi:hypothetical protein